MKKYGQPLREAALRRILPPSSEPMSQVARDLVISIQTLINWKKKAVSEHVSFEDDNDQTDSLSSQDKFQVVLETAGLKETEISE